MKGVKIPKGDNQNPYIEEEQTTQWPKGKVEKDKQQSTKHISKTIFTQLKHAKAKKHLNLYTSFACFFLFIFDND